MERVTTSLMQACNSSVSLQLQFSCSLQSIFISLSLIFSWSRLCWERIASGNKEMWVRESEERKKERKKLCEGEMCRGLSEHQYFSGWNLGWIIQPWCHAVSLSARLLAWTHTHTHTLNLLLFLSEMEVALQNHLNLLYAGIPSFFNLPPLLPPSIVCILLSAASLWFFIKRRNCIYSPWTLHRSYLCKRKMNYFPPLPLKVATVLSLTPKRRSGPHKNTHGRVFPLCKRCWLSLR